MAMDLQTESELREEIERLRERLSELEKSEKERKQLLSKLHASEEKYRLIAENSRDFISLFYNDILTYVSPGISYVLGYSPEEFFRYDHLLLIHPDDRVHIRQSIDSRLQNKVTESKKYIYRQKHKDGKYRWLETVSQRKIIDNSNVITILNTRDISKQKRIESELIQSKNDLKRELAEKEQLIQELHHRVKNNLSIVESLLSFQMDKIESIDDAKRTFLACCCRIHTMAMVHEKFYKSDSFAYIDMRSYIRSLVEDLMNIYTKDRHIRISFDIERVILDISQALPLGLIINELVNNAINHAFDTQPEAQICISLKQLDFSSYQLCISDNGKGLEEDIDINNPPSLGLRLVSLLSDQLEGSLKVKKEPLTLFTLTFPSI